MTRPLDDELSQLRERIVRMGGLVEDALARATAALVRRQPELARAVADADDAIDALELDIDEECLRILALYHPVAGDLRFITAVLKINNDLERIGDLAANLAERAIDLAEQRPPAVRHRIDEMVTLVRGMLHESLEALVHRDAVRARNVLAADRRVNTIHREHFAVLQESMKSGPEAVEPAVDLLSASRQLERIGDQAKNIAEDVVFLVEAQVIRHGRAARAPDAGRPR